VDAVEVRHEPVTGAVAYGVRTADAVVVISGDTMVCDEVAELADGADVLVHEACRATALASHVAVTTTLPGYAFLWSQVLFRSAAVASGCVSGDWRGTRILDAATA
jgi:hypothetical protein